MLALLIGLITAIGTAAVLIVGVTQSTPARSPSASS
jgi:hypothetical protein